MIKGFSLSHLIYNDIYSRASGDIDILVSEDNMLIMEKTMLKLGYIRQLDSPDDQLSEQYKDMILKDRISTIYNLSYDNHEVNYYKSFNEMFEIHFEIKRATSSISKKYIYDFLQSTEIIRIDNFKVKTLNSIYTLIHLFANTHQNTEHALFWGKNINLRDYFDTYNFLIKNYRNIDLKLFFNLCTRYQIVDKVIHVLENLQDLFPNGILKEIIDFTEKEKIEVDPLNNTIVQWENSFLDRLFSNEVDIVHDFNRLFKERCYSSRNKNYFNRYQLKDPHYIKFEDKKHGKHHLFYKHSFESDELILSLKLSEKLSKDFHKFKLLWRIIDNGTNKEITNKDFLISKVDCKVISEFKQRNFIKNISESFPDKEIKVSSSSDDDFQMQLAYSLDELFIDMNKSNNLLCYNIILLEEVLPGMYQLIGTQFSDFNPGVIKFPSPTDANNH